VINEVKTARREARELGRNIIPFDDVTIMFQDEARFGRINSPHKCWVKGERPVVYCQIVREYTYAYASVCPFDGTLDSLILPWVFSAAMNIFLAGIAKRHINKHILMFLDQAGWHKAKDLVIPQNIRLVPIPAYSPELNPAEHIWDELREKYFHNITFDTIPAVEDMLEIGLRDLENNKALVQSTTGFEWIISCI
jgi:transposase